MQVYATFGTRREPHPCTVILELRQKACITWLSKQIGKTKHTERKLSSKFGNAYTFNLPTTLPRVGIWDKNSFLELDSRPKDPCCQKIRIESVYMRGLVLRVSYNKQCGYFIETGSSLAPSVMLPMVGVGLDRPIPGKNQWNDEWRDKLRLVLRAVWPCQSCCWGWMFGLYVTRHHEMSRNVPSVLLQ